MLTHQRRIKSDLQERISRFVLNHFQGISFDHSVFVPAINFSFFVYSSFDFYYFSINPSKFSFIHLFITKEGKTLALLYFLSIRTNIFILFLIYSIQIFFDHFTSNKRITRLNRKRLLGV